MKNCILFFSALFVMLLTSSVSAQAVGTDAGKQGSATGSPTERPKCCAKVYVELPAAMKGGKPTSKLLSANPFKGKNAGLDLSMDVLDPAGKPITGGWEMRRNPAGDMIINAENLPKGRKYRLRVKAGTATEYYNF
ncbi:MAG: hypothetical protein WAS55_02690 [Saprospiraceae bacterium]|nr:hypothetical protein [Saprospiraceae bacterium]MBK9220788.1 hypothetical protein [Saprospiraceae bacterium]